MFDRAGIFLVWQAQTTSAEIRIGCLTNRVQLPRISKLLLMNTEAYINYKVWSSLEYVVD